MKVQGVLYLYRDEFKKRVWEDLCEAHNLDPNCEEIKVVYSEIEEVSNDT